jgi:glycosyltransferase involved in cell wall biosynthesis
MGMGIQTLSVFFPAYNDALALPGLLDKTFAVLPLVAEDFEVIVVNDGSQDDTDQVLLRLAARYGSRLRVVRHAVNQGYGAAVRSGFRAAVKDYIFYTDGDAQYDINELPSVIAEIRAGIGLVNGYKISRSDVFYRILLGKVYLAAVRRLFGLKIRDVDCDFRVVKRSFLERITLESTSGTICVELVRKLQDTGCGVVEIPVHHLPRLHGRSQYFRPMSLLKSLWQLAVLYFQLLFRRKSAAPAVLCDTE